MLDGLAFWLTALVAGLHVIFALAEMVFWPKVGPRLLRTRDPAAIALTKPIMFNQGFYNLGVVTGLVWALIVCNEALAIGFLIFVVLAGLVGWATVTIRIFLIQSLPALAALAAILMP